MPFCFKVNPSGLPPQNLDTHSLMYFMRWYLLTDSDFSCLAKLAKPYPVV